MITYNELIYFCMITCNELIYFCYFYYACLAVSSKSVCICNILCEIGEIGWVRESPDKVA